MKGTYDRYKLFRNNGVVELVPFIEIPYSATDISISFNRNTMRMDTLSYKYYGNPNYGWLILQANPELGGYEYLIANGTNVRIPYPLDSAINRYRGELSKYLQENQ